MSVFDRRAEQSCPEFYDVEKLPSARQLGRIPRADQQIMVLGRSRRRIRSRVVNRPIFLLEYALAPGFIILSLVRLLCLLQTDTDQRARLFFASV